VIFEASLHCKDESKTYGILNTLLAPYTELLSSNNPMTSVFTTPQDKLVGPEKMRAAHGEESICVIPDMTVKITRREGDSEGSGDRQVILVVEAKRLCINTPGSAYVLTRSNTCSLICPLR